MATRYELPTMEDLKELARRREHAVTVYVSTSPIVSERATSQVSAKSAVDAAIRHFREQGISHAEEEELRSQWEAIAAGPEPWSNLSSSLAIFIAPGFGEVYVLPNRLENQHQAADNFDLGQLLRVIAFPQEAYALTLSTNGWNLWRATATTRTTEFEVKGDHPADAADATNRATIRGRQHDRRLVGDEGRKSLLETYAARVAEAVASELNADDPHRSRPLFVFATDPLLDFYCAIDQRRQLVPVPGAPDGLRADQIDERIRECLAGLNAARTTARLESIGNDVSSGLVLTDLGDIARAAAYGAVQTLIYNFTIDILGSFDDITGEIAYAEGDQPGYDLLSRIAIKVLDGGGEVVAVRSDEVSGTVWNHTAVAHLRFPLA